MIDSDFSIEDSLSFGWTTFKSNVALFLKLAGVSLGIGLASIIVAAIIGSQAKGAAASLMLLAYVVMFFVYMGWINVALKLKRGETPEIGDLFQPISQFFPFVVALVLVGAAAGIGSILFIVPGIILGIRLQFGPYFVVDQQCGPIEALQRSWNATRGFGWKLFGLAVVIWLVNLVGELALGVGLLVSVPVSVMAQVDVYTKLRDRAATFS